MESRILLRGLMVVAGVFVIAGAWCFVDARRSRGPDTTVRFSKIDGAAVQAAAAARVVRELSPLPDRPEQWQWYLTRDEAATLIPHLGRSSLANYDPWMYCVGPTMRRDVMTWPEHPGGRVVMNTNSVGLRGRVELAEQLPDLRVLVAGDSHTHGVCNAFETFPALLGISLRRLNPGKSVESLNAAYGGFTFYQYAGTLLRWRERTPQVFVVAVFGGNDFMESLPFASFFARTKLVEWAPDRLQLRQKALARGPNAMGQALHSAFLFDSMPALADVAMAAAEETMSETRNVAEQIGTRFVVCFIPNPCTYTFDPPLPEVQAVLQQLRPTGFTLDAQLRLESRFVERMQELGIECVDMRATFAAEPTPPYWRKDLHLSLRGQRLIADALEPLVDDLVNR